MKKNILIAASAIAVAGCAALAYATVKKLLDHDCCDCCCDDDDFDFSDDDELYEVTCPTCGDTILLDESIIDEGSMNCPNCDELLEFDYNELTIEDFENEAEESSEEE